MSDPDNAGSVSWLREQLDRQTENAAILLRERDDYRYWNERVRVCEHHTKDIAAPVGDCLVCAAETEEQRREAAEARVRDLEEALRELVGWQPHTDKVLATLHPQHREAIEKARALLGSGEEQERQT